MTTPIGVSLVADCTIRRRDESWIEVVLRTPTYAGELGKAHRIMLGELGCQEGLTHDDAYMVVVGDDEIILRAKAPTRMLKVSWADSAVEEALDRLIAFRDDPSVPPLNHQERALKIAIDAVRMIVHRSGEPPVVGRGAEGEGAASYTRDVSIHETGETRE